VRSVSSELDCIPYPVVSDGSVRLEVGFAQSNSSRRFVSGSDHPDLARNTGVLML
jgi:hypothetical protein